MSSETFFDIGQTVGFSKIYIKTFNKIKSQELLSLRGKVIDQDFSPRECCYYGIAWDASPELLEKFDIEPDDYIQSDYLTGY